MSSVYSDLGGMGSVAAAQMAVKDFGGKVLGKPIEIVYADHQNKPDVGSPSRSKWFDEDGVDAIVDLPTSSVALAVQKVAQDRGKVDMISNGGSSELTDKACSPTGVHWTYDTYALAHVTGGAVVKQGGDTWFFITADYAFGHALQDDTAAVVKAAGGKVVGSVNVPLNNADFSSFLLQAQQSKAKIIGLANAGGDTVNSIKQAAEFGIVQGGQRLAGLLVFIADVDSLGLKTAQGLLLYRGLLLGPERRDPRLRQELRGRLQRQGAHLGPGRRLQRGHALPEGDAGRQNRGRRQGGGADARACRSTTS